MSGFADDQQLIYQWKEFIKNINDNPTFNSIIIKPCIKCADLEDTAPEKSKIRFLSSSEIKDKLSKNSQLIESSNPFLKYISSSLKGIPHIVSLTDNHGWIIDLAGTPEELNIKNKKICIGARWCQRNTNTDNIKTKLAIKNPVFTYNIKPSNKACGACCCIYVPIKLNEKIIGNLVLSTPNKYAHPAIFSLATICGNSIETALSDLENKQNNHPLLQISDLMATTVHDLKNPLAVIRGLGQLSKITQDKNVLNGYLDKIITQVDELNDIIVELLSIFKPSQLFPKEVVPVIQEVINEFQPQCKFKNIKISFMNNGDGFINMCENLFKRAIQNILINALQLMDNGGQIEIETKTEEQSIVITIKDTAGGIPEDIKDSLFQAFTFRRGQGTGLGLFMVYHTIASTHKGKIWFESEKNKGTTFFIKIPITKNIENMFLSKYEFI
ncbi:sensor histidine kinase [Clostridium sp. WILCCON 0269]|uniref:histidine kinase n=1 Tax=Candidatus Clostridium eludens TaxID=3381663 RepID=A0ABW8SIA7_9CLOT